MHCRAKFLRRIYPHPICEKKVEQRKHQRIYVKNPQKRKPQRKEKIPLNQKDYNEFSVLYYGFNFLGFDPLLRRKMSSFTAEG